MKSFRYILIAAATIFSVGVFAQVSQSEGIFSGGLFGEPLSQIFEGRPARFSVVDTTTFHLNPDGATVASGPSNLSATLTVNSIPVSPTLDYDARNAGATWTATAGPNLTCGGVVTQTRLAMFTESAARGARLAANSDRCNSASDTTTGNISATEDFAFEMVFCAAIDSSNNPYQFSKNSGAGLGGTGGWWLGGTTILDVAIGDGTTARSLGSTTITKPACYHVMVFGDHDEATTANGLVAFINGGAAAAFSGSLAAVGAIAGSSSTTLLNLGSSTYGQFQGNGLILARMWKGAAGWFAGGATNATEWASIAKTRFSQLTGVYPATAVGTALASTLDRGSIKWVDGDIDSDGVRRLAPLGSHWIPAVRRKEATGGEYGEGILIERSTTNIALESERHGTAPWLSMGAPYDSTVAADVVAGPNGFTTADGIIGTAPNNSHPREQQSISLTNTTVYTVSTFVKDGDSATTHATLYLGGGGAPDDGASVLLSTCGSVGRYAAASTITARAEDWGNGWCRLIFTFTADATAATTSIFVGAGASGYDDNGVDDTGYVGNGATVDVYVWGTQLEAGPLASTPISTTTASATRQNDSLVFASASNYPASQPISLEAKVLLPDFRESTVETKAFACGTNTTNDNFIRIQPGAGNNVFGLQGHVSSVRQFDIDGTTDVSNGEIMTIRTTAATNSVKGYQNGVQVGSEDVSATVPVASISLCYAGKSSTSGQELNGLLLSARIWSSVVAP